MHARRSSLITLVSTLLLTACGSKAPGDVNTLGGTVQGLTASGLVLRLNATHEIAVPAGATDFQFGSFEEGAAYDIRVKTQPDGQTCTVSGGQGTMAGASVHIEVTCSEEAHAVGGSVSGLGSGETVTLALNGEPYIVSATGTYTFPGSIPYGATYAVIVVTAPAEKLCAVAHASDTMAHAAVADVNVDCAPPAACGNEHIEAGEQCDLGTDENGVSRNTAQSSCSPECQTNVCGDGYKYGGDREECERGDAPYDVSLVHDRCNYGVRSCTLCSVCHWVQGKTSYCGDGTTDAANGEECDTRTTVDPTQCPAGQATCKLCSSRCTWLSLKGS